MGSLEQMPTVEMPNPMETQVPPEVLEMDNNLVSGAKVIFQNNHELVKEAMFGMGSRKAKEVLDNLAKCRKDAVEALKNFRAKKERLYH